MRITHLGHACVLAQTDTAKVLIDPGNMSEGEWFNLTDLDAVVVTHLHPDHLDPEHAPALLAANPKARVLVEPGIVELIKSQKLPELPGAEAFPAGSTADVDGLTIRAVGGRHAIIHRDVPQIGNVGVVLSAEGEPTLFHPGDAYDTTPEGVDVLAMPTYGPWAAMKETIDFVRAVGAPAGFPVHEALLNERGFGMIFGRVNDMTDTKLQDLRGGQTHTF